MKFSIKNIALVALLSAGGTGIASASDVLVTPVSNGKQTVITFELSNTSNAVGVQFHIALPGMSPKLVDTSGCNGGGNGIAACSFKDGVLRVARLDTSLKGLPTAELGSVTINAPISALSALQPQAILVSNADSQLIDGELLLDLQHVRSLLNTKQLADFSVK